MKKIDVSIIFFLILILTCSWLLVLSLSLQKSTLLAAGTWTDSFSVYQNVTVLQSAIRQLFNNYSFAIDVRVYIVNVNPLSKVSLYQASANGTAFITLTEGSVILSQNTYYGLQPSQKLSFDLLAKPTLALSVGQTIVVTKKVELYESVPVAPFIPFIKPPKYPFDIQITNFPSIVYQPFQTCFDATLVATNMGSRPTDATIHWYVTDADANRYNGGNITLYINAKETKEFQVQILAPEKDGRYTLHAEVIIPSVVVADVAFQVIVIPIWLIILLLVFIATILILSYRRKKS